MRVAGLDYALPPELVAQAPSPDRDAARLLVVPREGELLHRRVSDLAELVAPGTLIVLNDTRVVPARLLGTKVGTGGRAEIFLVRRLDNLAQLSRGDDGIDAERWSAMGRASKGLREGSRIEVGDLVVEVEGRGADDGLLTVRLTTKSGSHGSVERARTEAGRMPLPPYIRREAGDEDAERYQTVYARAPGAVAAPTAGLHFTEALLEALRARGCEIATCTLHVGLGTFQPVTVDDLDDHPMHAEIFEVSPALADAIARARARGADVMAVGTTVVRALESASDPTRPGHVSPRTGETRLLLQPGAPIRVVDRLMTNFHLPKSTLLALVCAFAGTARVLEVYARAVEERYRFFSYGDAMLLERSDRAARGDGGDERSAS